MRLHPRCIDTRREKDAALERRFQPIPIDEPSPERTREILEGIKPQYEEHHDVIYSPDALDAAVKCARRTESGSARFSTPLWLRVPTPVLGCADDAFAGGRRYSIRYINDRFLPDKAIDLLDEAGALLQLAGDSKGTVRRRSLLRISGSHSAYGGQHSQRRWRSVRVSMTAVPERLSGYVSLAACVDR